MGPLLIEIRASIFSSFEEIQITFSSNFYRNISVKICNLEQMIARELLAMGSWYPIELSWTSTVHRTTAVLFWLSLVKFWVFVKRFRILRCFYWKFSKVNFQTAPVPYPPSYSFENRLRQLRLDCLQSAFSLKIRLVLGLRLRRDEKRRTADSFVVNKPSVSPETE